MTLGSWVEQLQSRGRYTFTRAEVEEQTERSPVAAQSALRRLRRLGRIASPRRDFHVIVPPEYRTAGSPPASWFVDDLMRYLGQPYYVSLLSAAALHGAAHQQPMTFQVVTSRPTRPIRCGRVSVRFLMSSDAQVMPASQAQTETGTIRLATPETTAFDLVRYPAAAGGLGNVATVLAELAERLDPEALVRIAPLVRLPDVQRLGYLLDVVGAQQKSMRLARWLDVHEPRPVLLRPGAERRATTVDPWRVIPNEDLELDL